MAPLYSDIGKASKDLLLGNPKSGAFSFDPKVSFASTTSNGVSFAVNAIKKGEKVEPTLKVAYSAKNYSVDALFSSDAKTPVNCSLSGIAPGAKVSFSALLPDPSSAKLAVDYSLPYLALKATVGLTVAPLVDLTASTGHNGLTVGGECAYDTAKSALTKYNVGVGYQGGDFQVAAFLADKGTTAKLAYAHNVTATATVGAEIVRKLATSDTTFTVGYAKKLTSGALAKVKIDNTGALSALYETKLSSGEKVAGALQVQATDLSKPVKYGFALDLF